MKPYRIAILHMEIRMGSKRSNLKLIQSAFSSMLTPKRSGEVNAVVLPQYPFTGPIIGYHSDDRVPSHLRNAAERLQPGRGGSGFTVNTLSRLAGEYGVSIIGGPLVERAGPWLYLTMFYINDRGEVEAKYRKVTLSDVEKRYAIGHGSSAGIFALPGGLRIGVFADNDLVNPELFRLMQIEKANIIIGTYLPSKASLIPVEERGGLLYPKRELLRTLVVSRSFETGLPLILVGGIVLDSNGGYPLAYSETLIIDPDQGIIESYTRGIDDSNTRVIVEVNPESSTPRVCDDSCMTAIKILCKKKRGAKT
jgi:predicted amidohydrolase